LIAGSKVVWSEIVEHCCIW